VCRSSAGEAATPSVSADDLHTVIMALRSGVDRRVRLRAALLPASVLARWFAVGSRWRGQG
jgi:hypothetical protein